MDDIDREQEIQERMLERFQRLREEKPGFVRTKKIKGHIYYYLVKSERVNGKMKQRTIKYFGKKKPSESDLIRFKEVQ